MDTTSGIEDTLYLRKRHCMLKRAQSMNDNVDIGDYFIAIPYTHFNDNTYDKQFVPEWRAKKSPYHFIQFFGEEEKYPIVHVWKKKTVNIRYEGTISPELFDKNGAHSR